MNDLLSWFAVPVSLSALGVVLVFGAYLAGGDLFFAAMVGVLTPLVLVVPGWLAREGWRRGMDRRALRRLLDNDARVSGQWVAVAGTVRAVTAPFEAPLSRRSALACRYRVADTPANSSPKTSSLRHRSSSRGTRPRFEGFHLVPTEIVDGYNKRVRLKAMPELRNLEKRLGGGISRIEQRAIEAPAGGLRRQVARKRIFRESKQRVSVDWTFPIDGREGASMTLTEWALLPDAEVCLIGRWDASGALLPHWSRTAGIPVYPGSPQEVMENLSRERRVYYTLAVLLLGLLAASFAWLFL